MQRRALFTDRVASSIAAYSTFNCAYLHCPSEWGIGVISGLAMAVRLGTNWSMLAARAGSIQGPLPGYKASLRKCWRQRSSE
jgi:hypothetical protein